MKHKKFLIGWIFVVAVLAVACFLVPSTANQETIQEAMKDAVLHETGRVSLFGLKNVNPGLISGTVVTAFLLIVAALIRIFAIPKFQYVPGKFQMLLEQVKFPQEQFPSPQRLPGRLYLCRRRLHLCRNPV